MTQGQKLLPDRLVDALIDSGTWMSGAELRSAFKDRSQVAVDDALADLVVDGRVDYRENVGYRFSGTAICRRAAQLMRRERMKAAVIGVPTQDGYHVGVAETRAGLGMVMYELAMPMAAPDQDALELRLQQVGGVMQFLDSRGGRNA